MARVRLALPERMDAAARLTVRAGDVNYGGHLGNDALLSLLQEARIRFLARLGFTETDVAGVGIIMTDAAVVYKSEAFHGDVLRIDVAVDDLSGRGCDFMYRVVREADSREVARAKTGIVFFDYETRRMAHTPDAFRSALAASRDPGPGTDTV